MLELVIKIWIVSSVFVFVDMGVVIITGYFISRAGHASFDMNRGDIIPFIVLVILGPVTPFVFMYVIYNHEKSIPDTHS